jgi:hypothetical protein
VKNARRVVGGCRAGGRKGNFTYGCFVHVSASLTHSLLSSMEIERDGRREGGGQIRREITPTPTEDAPLPSVHTHTHRCALLCYGRR